MFEFAQQHGTLPRREGSKARPLLSGEALLYGWCANQRSRRAGNHSSNLHRPLTEWEAAKLEDIPFWYWGWPYDEEWEQRFQEVAAFVAKHSRLPRRVGSKATPLSEEERVLGRWCFTQRRRRKGQELNAALTEQQVARLEGLQLWFWRRAMSGSRNTS